MPVGCHIEILGGQGDVYLSPDFGGEVQAVDKNELYPRRWKEGSPSRVNLKGSQDTEPPGGGWGAGSVPLRYLYSDGSKLC